MKNDAMNVDIRQIMHYTKFSEVPWMKNYLKSEKFRMIFFLLCVCIRNQFGIMTKKYNLLFNNSTFNKRKTEKVLE
jgi:hypothetical protein